MLKLLKQYSEKNGVPIVEEPRMPVVEESRPIEQESRANGAPVVEESRKQESRPLVEESRMAVVEESREQESRMESRPAVRANEVTPLKILYVKPKFIITLKKNRQFG